jgi:hypothetical protein
VYAPIKQ